MLAIVRPSVSAIRAESLQVMSSLSVAIAAEGQEPQPALYSLRNVEIGSSQPFRRAKN
jgi:hypothetical protein